MLRTEEQRELDREFTQIETWKEFLERWQAIGTEQEAVGLFYAGAAVLWEDRLYQTVAEVAERVGFYLRWATHKNAVIQATAQ